MKRKEDQNRTIRFTVRVNEKEAKWLREASWREKRSIADFIRSRAIAGELPRIPVGLSDLLNQFNYEINKIGVNINQLIHSYHVNGYQSAYEKQKLAEDLKELYALRDFVFEQIGRLADGNYKTPAP